MPLPPLSPDEAEEIHRIVMAEYIEEPSGVLNRGLLESTLLRPVNAVLYSDVDEYYQAGTLLWGLVSNHAFIQGNKRTATAIVFFFLERAGFTVEASDQAVLDIVYAIDAGTATVEDTAEWFRRHTRPSHA